MLSLGRKVIETSHTERTLKPHERRALHAQWAGRCAVAGCTSPPGTPLVPHHPNPWHVTGTTSYHDTVPLCDSNHHDLHEGGRTLRLRDGRRLGPHGWVDPAGGQRTRSRRVWPGGGRRTPRWPRRARTAAALPRSASVRR